MSSMNKWFCLPILAALLVACGGDDDPYGRNGVDIADTVAIKISPVSANAPGLSVVVDVDLADGEAGTPLDDLAYGQVAIFGLTPGTLELTVRGVVPEGAGPEGKYEDIFTTDSIETTGGNRYEIFVAGSYPDIDYWVTETPLEYAEADTQARLTVVNASTTMPSMDIHLTAVDAPIDTASLIATLGANASDNSIRVDEGEYQMKVTAAGSSTVIYTSPVLSFAPNMDLSLVAIDNAWIKDGLTDKPPIAFSRSGASGSAALMFSVDTGSDLRAVNAWPAGGSLDIHLKQDMLVEPFETDIQPGEVTPYQTVEGGTYGIQIEPVGVERNFNLINGVAWTMVVTEPDPESEEASAPIPLFVSENAREIAAYSRVRIIHASGSAETVDIYITEPNADFSDENADGDPLYTPLGTGLALRTASGYISVAEGSYDITFTRTVPEGETAPDLPDIVYGPIEVTFTKGEIYTLVLRDQADLTTVTHQWLDGAPEVVPAP